MNRHKIQYWLIDLIDCVFQILSENKIGNEGVVALCHILCKNDMINKLDLSGQSAALPTNQLAPCDFIGLRPPPPPTPPHPTPTSDSTSSSYTYFGMPEDFVVFVECCLLPKLCCPSQSCLSSVFCNHKPSLSWTVSACLGCHPLLLCLRLCLSVCLSLSLSLCLCLCLCLSLSLCRFTLIYLPCAYI